MYTLRACDREAYRRQKERVGAYIGRGSNTDSVIADG